MRAGERAETKACMKEQHVPTRPQKARPDVTPIHSGKSTSRRTSVKPNTTWITDAASARRLTQAEQYTSVEETGTGRRRTFEQLLNAKTCQHRACRVIAVCDGRQTEHHDERTAFVVHKKLIQTPLQQNKTTDRERSHIHMLEHARDFTHSTRDLNTSEDAIDHLIRTSYSYRATCAADNTSCTRLAVSCIHSPPHTHTHTHNDM